MHVTLFPHEKATFDGEAIGTRLNLDNFQALCEMLCDVVITDDKTGQRGWSPAVFTGDHRKLENVEKVSVLVLDVDVPELPELPEGSTGPVVPPVVPVDVVAVGSPLPELELVDPLADVPVAPVVVVPGPLPAVVSVLVPVVPVVGPSPFPGQASVRRVQRARVGLRIATSCTRP